MARTLLQVATERIERLAHNKSRMASPEDYAIEVLEAVAKRMQLEGVWITEPNTYSRDPKLADASNRRWLGLEEKRHD